VLGLLRFCGKLTLAVVALMIGLVVLFVLPVWFIPPPKESLAPPIKTAYIPTPETLRDHPEMLSQTRVAGQIFKIDQTILTSYFEVAPAEDRQDLPTIVYLHGGPVGYLSGSEMEWVARLGWPHRVLFFQQPGSGMSARLDSAADPASLGNQLAWLNKFITDKGNGPVIIIAHSFGTITASHYAAKHPKKVRAMLFLGPSYPISEAHMVKDLADAALLAKQKPLRAARYRMGTAGIIATPVSDKPSDAAAKAVLQKLKHKRCAQSQYDRLACRAAAEVSDHAHPLSNRLTLAGWLEREAQISIWDLPIPRAELPVLERGMDEYWTAEGLLWDWRETPLKLSPAARAIPVVAIRGINDTVDRDLVLLHGRDRSNFTLIEEADTSHSPQYEGCYSFDAARYGLSLLTGLKPEGECRQYMRDNSSFARTDNSLSLFYIPSAVLFMNVMYVEGRPRPPLTAQDCAVMTERDEGFAPPSLPLCQNIR
jgi:pimeloyl-ACP methyl ester carboxylesterase